jgi:1-carboxybiuret hydrolase subunit AtzH-like protein
VQIDLPDVVAEVRAAFERYERALVSNDVVTLDEMFRSDPRTIRYGQGENLYGYTEIESFRAVRPSSGLARTLSKTLITTFGRHALAFRNRTQLELYLQEPRCGREAGGARVGSALFAGRQCT